VLRHHRRMESLGRLQRMAEDPVLVFQHHRRMVSPQRTFPVLIYELYWFGHNTFVHCVYDVRIYKFVISPTHLIRKVCIQLSLLDCPRNVDLGYYHFK
jgi:hypothetical protein